MATFHTPKGKVRYSGNRRFIVVVKRHQPTKDGCNAVVVKRTDRAETARRHQRAYTNGAVTVDTAVQSSMRYLPQADAPEFVSVPVGHFKGVTL